MEIITVVRIANVCRLCYINREEDGQTASDKHQQEVLQLLEKCQADVNRLVASRLIGKEQGAALVADIRRLALNCYDCGRSQPIVQGELEQSCIAAYRKGIRELNNEEEQEQEGVPACPGIDSNKVVMMREKRKI